MIRHIGKMAISVAHRHPVITGLLTLTGAATVAEGIYHMVKPKPSTAQTTAPSAPAAGGQ